MNEQDQEIFRQQLLKMQKDLLEVEISAQDAASIVTLDQSKVGRLSRMDALQGQAMSQEMNRRRQIEQNKILAALQRIDQGMYGYCAHCEEEIAVKRLQFDPSAPLCIDCANNQE